MRTLKLTAIAAVAIFAAAAGSQVRGGVYDYSYTPSYGTPTYNGYPISGSQCPCRSTQCSSMQCPSGQCGCSMSVPSSTVYAPPYSNTTFAPSTTYGTGASRPMSNCPNGCCGSCRVNGGCNGRCGTCPAGTHGQRPAPRIEDTELQTNKRIFM